MLDHALVRGMRPRFLACLIAATLAAEVAAQDRPSREVRAIEVGTVHPVSGPPIENGVIVMRGSRIVAVGAADEIDLPPGTEVMSYPDAHAYPGMVDALSIAFGDSLAVSDSSSDAGTVVFGGLDPYDEASRNLVEWGVTTVYVSNRGETTWRGMGAVLHPRADGFEPADGKTATANAVHMRISGGGDDTHPLARQKALRDLGKPFTELKGYKKQKNKHAQELKDYAEKYEEYLDYFRKKKSAEAGGETKGEDETGTAGGDKAEGKPAEKPGEQPEEKPADKPSEKPEDKPVDKPGDKPVDKPAKNKGKGEAAKNGVGEKAEGNEKKKNGDEAAKKADDAPKKPDYPKPPTPEPAKDALLEVADGAISLHVEARRVDEIRAALELRREHEVPKMVLEIGDEAGALASEIAEAGIPVITAGFVDAVGPADAKRFCGDLPAVLSAAGVDVAIASGSVRSARYLPLLAAYACGRGLDQEAAVAAITLTPATILGMSRSIGSLEAGKRADVVITSGPLLSSGSVILAVLSGGQVQFENM